MSIIQSTGFWTKNYFDVWCELAINLRALAWCNMIRSKRPTTKDPTWSMEAPVTGLLTPESGDRRIQSHFEFLTQSLLNPHQSLAGVFCMNCISKWRAEMHVHPVTLVVELRQRESNDSKIVLCLHPSSELHRSRTFHQLLELFMCVELEFRD